MTDPIFPLVPAEVDLTDFAFMPLDVRRLRDSDLAALEAPEACWAAVLLWSASWHQVPAGSIPDDDRVLAQLAGYGRVVKEWVKVREGALRGFVKCSDGRLYHPVIAEKALEAWDSKQRHAYWKCTERLRKENKKRTEANQQPLGIPTLDQWKSGIGHDGIPPENNHPSGGNDDDSSGNPPENALKGEGQGEGKGQGQGESIESKGGAGENPPPDASPAATPQARKPAKEKSDSQGSRLPKDWVLPKKWGEWAMKDRPELSADDIRKEGEKFRNYWVAKAGKDARKTDWEATWQNWIRSEFVKPSGTGINGNGAGGPWFMSSTAIEAKAKELGIDQQPGELWPHFRDRVYAKAGVTPEMIRKAKIDAGERV